MKPYAWIPIVGATCITVTVYAAFDHNARVGVAADLQLMAEATKNEKKTDSEKSRLHFLNAIANEVIAEKVADVLFDDQGILRLSHLPKRIIKDQSFNIGPTSLVVPSVGVQNLKTKKYAAIAILDGRLQIVQVYSPKEVQNTISKIQQGAKS